AHLPPPCLPPLLPPTGATTGIGMAALGADPANGITGMTMTAGASAVPWWAARFSDWRWARPSTIRHRRHRPMSTPLTRRHRPPPPPTGLCLPPSPAATAGLSPLRLCRPYRLVHSPLPHLQCRERHVPGQRRHRLPLPGTVLAARHPRLRQVSPAAMPRSIAP